jgi:hypothetical protein
MPSSLCYTESFFRPILRRRERVFLPPFVDIRTRKPCVVALFFLLGLYVIDMAVFYMKKGNQSRVVEMCDACILTGIYGLPTTLE